MMAAEWGCDTDVEPHEVGIVTVTRCPFRPAGDDGIDGSLLQDAYWVLEHLEYLHLEVRRPTPRAVDLIAAVSRWKAWWDGWKWRHDHPDTGGKRNT